MNLKGFFPYFFFLMIAIIHIGKTELVMEEPPKENSW